jgi:hypothetical protein
MPDKNVTFKFEEISQKIEDFVEFEKCLCKENYQRLLKFGKLNCSK